MRLDAKEIKRLSAIKNSVYDDLKINFLYNSNNLEGSTFTKENLEKLLSLKKVEGEHYLDDVSFLVDVFSKCQKRLDEKMIDYKNTIDLVKREIESEDR